MATVFLLAQGWFMVWNARHVYDPELFEFAPIAAPLAAGPGAIDGGTAWSMMVRVSALLGALLFAVDLFQERLWRRRFAWTVFVAGTSVVSFGLVQRILGAPMIFWGEARGTQHFFATYLYHGNAGSFINLVLPLVVFWTLRLFREHNQHLTKAICLPALLLTAAGAFVNVSKAAMVITLGLLVAISLLQLPTLRAEIAAGGGGRVTLGVSLGIAALAVLLLAGDWEMAWNRWARLPEILRNNPREIAVEAAAKMLGDSGWWGLGPGTFSIAFPHYTGDAGARIAGVWRYLHQDYLQTLVEWGWLGAAAWGILIFGGAVLAAWHGMKEGAPLSEARPLYLAAALGLGATALHARVDFPFQIASLQLYVITFAALGWSAWFRR
jgi:hypothetical protein